MPIIQSDDPRIRKMQEMGGQNWGGLGPNSIGGMGVLVGRLGPQMKQFTGPLGRFLGKIPERVKVGPATLKGGTVGMSFPKGHGFRIKLDPTQQRSIADTADTLAHEGLHVAYSRKPGLEGYPPRIEQIYKGMTKKDARVPTGMSLPDYVIQLRSGYMPIDQAKGEAVIEAMVANMRHAGHLQVR